MKFLSITLLAFIIGLRGFSQVTTNTDVGYVTVTVPGKSPIRKLKLPDGSIVWIDKASMLRYSSDAKKRIVELDGRAYFEIRRRTDTFIVRANNMLIKTLGCNINIQAFSSDRILRATLISDVGSFIAYDVTDNDSLSTDIDNDIAGVEISNVNLLIESARRKKLGLN